MTHYISTLMDCPSKRVIKLEGLAMKNIRYQAHNHLYVPNMQQPTFDQTYVS